MTQQTTLSVESRMGKATSFFEKQGAKMNDALDITELEINTKSKSSRVETLIYQYMVKHPSITTKGQADYYEDVHQGLAPLARELEIELINKDATILSLIGQISALQEEVDRYRSALEIIAHKFERAGGVAKVAHSGVEFGAMSWGGAINGALETIGAPQQSDVDHE